MQSTLTVGRSDVNCMCINREMSSTTTIYYNEDNKIFMFSSYQAVESTVAPSGIITVIRVVIVCSSSFTKAAYLFSVNRSTPNECIAWYYLFVYPSQLE